MSGRSWRSGTARAFTRKPPIVSAPAPRAGARRETAGENGQRGGARCLKDSGRPWSRPDPFSLSADLDLDRVVLLGLAGVVAIAVDAAEHRLDCVVLLGIAGVVAPAVEAELGVGGKRAIELEVFAGGGGLRCGEVHRGESCERQCDQAAFHGVLLSIVVG